MATIDPVVLEPLIGPERLDELGRRAQQLSSALGDAAVFCVNSTAEGGGVAEMLQMLLPYARGAGIDARWLVIDADETFFALTKRLHNHLHGAPGDGGPLGEGEHDHFDRVLHNNAAQLVAVVRRGDVVVLHDPQPAGLASALRSLGARVVWRCHIGSDTANEYTEIGWEFLRPYLEPPAVDAYVFTRKAFAPSWVPAELVAEIPPSIDPLSAKNRELSVEDTRAILVATGLLSGPQQPAWYQRSDGARRRLERAADLVRTGPMPEPDVPLVVQVSRWDRLKDMAGVIKGFADHVVYDHGAHLVVAGPVVTAVADDPEGAAVLQECIEAWQQLPHHARQRIALACLPMADREENAIIVNALQRHASVVVQKSLAEGFGLTVSEAMYKRRPVVGSAVGGIADQIADGETGILLADPTDLPAFGRALNSLLGQPERAAAMGERGHRRVVERFLPDTQLSRWAAVIESVLPVT